MARNKGIQTMARNTVQIENLHLRIPGLSREDGQRLGADVAQRIAESLPASGTTEHLGALAMRVSIREGTPPEQLARTIARSILEKLR
jgi:hypothetical protein